MNRIRKFFSGDTQGEQKVSTAKFTVKFTGPALDDGTMDVRDLTPALLAIGDSCTRANQLLNGSAAKVRTNVKADFKKGSFGIELILDQVINDKDAMDFVANANQILQLAGYVATTTLTSTLAAVGVIKKLKGRKPEKVEVKSDGVVNIFINGDSFDTTKRALALAADPGFVDNVKKAVSPITREGIESVVFGGEDNEDSVVTKDHLDSFTTPDPKDEPPVIESTHETVYEIIAPSLQDGYKWRLGGEGGSIMVAIEDENFLEDVKNGLYAFRAGDLLKVCIRQRAWQNPKGGVTRENTIMKVLKHIERPDAKLPEFPPFENKEPTP